MPVPLPEEPLATFREVTLMDLDRWAGLLLRALPATVSLGLVGTLGAGKTRLVQAIAAAAGVDPAEVTSPTFTLLQTHAGRQPNRGPVTLHHLDAYRIGDEEEFLQLGVEELFDQPAAWTLVEWADRVAEVMPPETLWVRMEIEPGGETRRIHLGSEQPENVAAAVREVVRDYEQQVRASNFPTH